MAGKEFAHTFHTASDWPRQRLNQAFCLAPMVVTGGASRRGLGVSTPLTWIVSGGLPPAQVLPAANIAIVSSSSP